MVFKKESPYLLLFNSIDKVGTDLYGREFGFNILLSFLSLILNQKINYKRRINLNIETNQSTRKRMVNL